MEWKIQFDKWQSITSLCQRILQFGGERQSLFQSFAAQRHQEFVGNGQHDAQELLTILLDAVHEVQNDIFSFTFSKENLPRISIE